MKKIFITFLACMAFTSGMLAQFSENFSDGDFTGSPSWNGSNSDWIINSSGQLQSNNSIANSSFFITTPSTLATTAQWEFFVQLAFNTSSANYTDVFLTASDSNLATASTTGYFVRIGGAADEIALYKKTGSTVTKIIDGIDGTTGNSNNTARIKVTHDAGNTWKLFRDLTGGHNYFLEGAAADSTYNTSAFFGILVKQSTVASFAQKHFFDDISAGSYIPDTTAPQLITATAVSATQLDLLFSESIDVISSQVAANYTAGNNMGSPVTAVTDQVNTAMVHLNFSNTFPNGNTITISVNGVQDMNGNTLINGTAFFSYYTPVQYDVVIDEIMANPSPVVALPDFEWIELKNNAAFPVHLAGWRLGDAGSISGPMPDSVLQPGSFIIVCASSATNAMSLYGKTIAVTSFPSLDNEGEILYITDAGGNIIHSVIYRPSWHQNALKQNGGWTLEMTDTKNPCAGYSNWQSCSDISGGTPGRKNSGDAINTDAEAPKLLRAYTTDSIGIVLVFDEPLSNTTTSVTGNYSISDGIGMPVTASPISPSFEKVALKLPAPLAPGKVYTITVSNITDCTGNHISNNKTTSIGLPGTADSFDIVINEILFNPPVNGVDYVELYNRSRNIVDLRQVYIANRSATGVISNITQLSPEPYLLFPQDFIVITENSNWVKSNFITLNPDAFVTVPALPSFSDDEGDVVVLNAQGNITDELAYKDDWHFKLLAGKEGVALERIDYNAQTQQESNWHSAATSVNYGTPTYRNSQFNTGNEVPGEINISPEIVSPDNDGQDDFATIDYHFAEPGYVANVTFFDASGRPVRYLQRNSICGTSGSFRWDGLGERNQQLSTGIYIMLAEVFNLGGKKKQFKKVIVVARKS